jgi:hypothetical protein
MAMTLDPQAVTQAKQGPACAWEEPCGDQVRESLIAGAHRVLEDAQRMAVRGHVTVVAVSDPMLTRL